MANDITATVDAINILQTAYDALLKTCTTDTPAPSAVRQIVMRAQDALSKDLRRMLTKGQSA